jgi:protein-S-isoprenylcysteine O-methyltransferase Ste14
MYRGGGFVMMPVSIQLILVCWIVFIGYWIISARGVKPMAEPPTFLSTLVYRAPLMVGGFLLWCGRFRSPLNLAVTPHTGPAQVAGVVVCGFGLIVTIWSRRILAGNWSSEVAFRQGHELIQTGPYRLVRHPIYTGLLLMCLGLAVAWGQLHCWLGFAIMFGGLWIKLKMEEALMLRHFPNDYPDYRKRTKALIPFVL